MKTSNKILLTVMIIGTAWLLIRDIIIANGVKELSLHKTSSFLGITENESQLVTEPFDKIFIQSDFCFKIEIRQSGEYKIHGRSNIMKSWNFEIKNRELHLTRNKKGEYNSKLIIECPLVSQIFSQNNDNSFPGDIQLYALKMDSLKIDIKNMYLSIDTSQISFLSINSNATITNVESQISLDKSNNIKYLELNNNGRSNVYLGTIGTESNHFNFGKLVSITTDGEILNKILK